eukprot:scaffold135898_cov50-Prasinocladus_malaysianus.AAC.1
MTVRPGGVGMWARHGKRPDGAVLVLPGSHNKQQSFKHMTIAVALADCVSTSSLATVRNEPPSGHPESRC